MKQSEAIELVVFDWAGTTTDFGSQAPIQVFERTFLKRGIQFTRDEINAPMGMEKRAHLRSMLATPRGTALWNEVYGAMWSEADIEALYQSFEQTMREVVAEYSQPIPGVPEAVSQLRDMGIKIGSTTGYTSEIMQYVLPVAEQGGYSPDCVITPDITRHSRPSPFMVFECMRQMNVYPASHVVKVGDTVMDMLEGKNAGAWTVGVLTGSNLVGLSLEEYTNAPKEEIDARKEKAKNAYRKAGTDVILDTMAELPDAIRALNSRLAAREEADAR